MDRVQFQAVTCPGRGHDERALEAVDVEVRMNGFGIFSLLAGGLQLTVPSYGLRLVRRFGTARVGWFLFIAFLSLALMRIVRPAEVDADGWPTQVLYAMGSILLLVGFGHLETLWSRESRTERQRDTLQRQWISQSEERNSALAMANQKMADEIKRLEQDAQALIDSEAQFRILFAEHPQPMWIFDLRSMRFLAVNKQALRHFGYERQEFMALSVPDLFAPDCAGAFVKDAARPCSRAEHRGTWRQRRKDGSTFELEMLGMDLKYDNYPARWLIGRDPVQLVEQEAAVFEARKLDAMARLAGGIGHHFNNALTIIDGKASLLLKNLTCPDLEQPLKDISATANRMVGMTRQLLAVGRRHPMIRETIDVKAMFQALYPMLRRLVGANVGLRNLCGSALPPVWGDPRLIEQMLVHLVLNARHAMSGSGTLTISASNVRMESVEAEKNEDVRPGEFVRIAIRDTGCGMSPEVQSRIFEPFFTTHEPGKAMGLGLASVFGAAKQQGGWVEFTSEAGAGSEFIIFLPCSARPIEHKAVQPAAPVAVAPGKTILLVEPEDRARGAACHLLKRQGYRVIEADNASTVMLLWEKQGPTVDLVLTEMNLPGETSGCAMAEQLQKDRPGLKVLYSSIHPPVEGLAAELGKVTIAKPYQADALLKTVATCLS